jgi:SAM-dependent methyltransferase
VASVIAPVTLNDPYPEGRLMSKAIATEPDIVQSTYAEWKTWDARLFGTFGPVTRAYYEAEIGPLLRGRSQPRVLEIGFGNGPFLGWCRARQLDYRGVELIPELRERAALLGIETYASLEEPALLAQRGAFDCVAAFDVIEHIEQRELPAFFQSIAALLKVGGHFVARFPNGDSPFGRPSQHGDLTHVTTLGRLKIVHLSKIAGLRVVSIGEPARATPQAMRARLAQLVERRARRVVERVAARLYSARGQVVPFAPNLVSVLQRRPGEVVVEEGGAPAPRGGS